MPCLPPIQNRFLFYGEKGKRGAWGEKGKGGVLSKPDEGERNFYGERNPVRAVIEERLDDSGRLAIMGD